MKNPRRRLKGNLKPNHFSLTFEDEYYDQRTLGSNNVDSPVIFKVESLCNEVQKATDRVLEQITDLRKFPDYCRNLSQTDITKDAANSLHAYFKGLNDALKQFESTVNELDTKHSDIKSMQTNFADLRQLIAEGKNLVASEKYRDSIEVYKKALEIKPSNELITMELLYDRAFASTKIGNFRDAIADCTQALSIDPIHVETRLLRAECNFYLDDFELSIRDYEIAISTTEIRRNPEKASIVNSKIETARKELQHNLAEAKNTKANEHFNSGNYQLAGELYSEAIDMWRENIVYYGNRCTCLIMQGNYKRALEDSRYMTLMDKTFTVGYDRLIRCCLIFGQYEDAEKAIKIRQEINTSKADTDIKYYIELCKKLQSHEQLAEESYNNKQILSAILHIDRGLQVLPESIHLQLLKAECFMCLGEIEEIQKLVGKSNFSKADGFYLNSLCSYYEGDILNALTQLKKSLSADPNHRQAKMMHAKLKQQNRTKIDGDRLFSLQKFREAADYYTQVIELEHFDNGFLFVILCTRASALSKIGNFRDAIKDCSRALDLYPLDVNMRLLRANCYHYLDEFQDAINDFKVALNADEVKMNSTQTEKIKSKLSELDKAYNRYLARDRKDSGDKCILLGKYKDALDHYAKAIEFWPENSSFYRDRAKCFIKLKDFKGAIKEYQSALMIDDNFTKGYYGLIKCYLVTDDMFGAEITIKEFNSTISKNDDIVSGYQKQCNELRAQKSLANDRYSNGLYGLTLSHVENALKIATESVKLKLLKGECLAMLGRFEEANEIATSCLKSDPSNSDAIYVQALCINQKDYNQGIELMEKAVKFDPDHFKAKTMLRKMKKLKQKEEMGNDLLQQGKYNEAIANYSEAIEISPIENAILPKILYNRAVASSKIGFIRDAINDCTKAIKNSWTYTQFLKLRAKCHMNMRNFRKGVEDYEALLKVDKSNEIEKMLKEAKFALTRSQSSNYYDILDINRTASSEDIKKSYKALALIHHPDKHSNVPQNETLEQQEIFKKISVAYEVLSDPVKRRAYDRKTYRNLS